MAEGGHSPAVAWAVQRLAIEAACGLFAKTAGMDPRVEIAYEAGDPAGFKAAEGARRTFGEFGNDLKIRDLIARILAAGDGNAAWRPRR